MIAAADNKGAGWNAMERGGDLAVAVMGGFGGMVDGIALSGRSKWKC